MSAPRLLQAIAGGEHGGAEAFFTRLAIALHGAGVEQRIVMRSNAPRVGLLRAAGLEPIEARFGGPLDAVTRITLAGEIRRFRPDIVLTWMNRATALMPPRFLARHRYVHVARLGGYYDLRYYRRCDHLIGNTQDLVEHMARSGWPRERIHYLPNFVDATAAAPIARAAFDTPDVSPLILALGRLHPNKAFDVLLRALAQAPGAYLWLAGEGGERAALEALAHELDIGARVRFLGWREDVAALMAAADMLACPSRLEPLGNVVIEAWAHRLPVIAAASAGPASLIRHEETGLLSPIDDPTALAASIRRLAADPAMRARLSAAGRLAYEAGFTQAAVVARYLDLFGKVAA